MPKEMDSIKVEVFLMPPSNMISGNQCGLDIYASNSLNDSSFTILNTKMETFPPLNNFYKFFIPAVYTCAEFPLNSKYLKIKFNGEAQLSRVEIIYSTIKKPDPDIVTIGGKE